MVSNWEAQVCKVRHHVKFVEIGVDLFNVRICVLMVYCVLFIFFLLVSFHYVKCWTKIQTWQYIVVIVVKSSWDYRLEVQGSSYSTSFFLETMLALTSKVSIKIYIFILSTVEMLVQIRLKKKT